MRLVFHNRVIRIVNLLIALAVLVVGGAIYWFAWRPLPATSGSIAAPVAGAGTIARGPLGQVVIRSGSLEDALFLQGYATAQDRMWQMEGIRRLAAGELAEIVGADRLAADREARQFRPRAMAETWEAALSRAERSQLAAYARGVNFYLETHRSRLPVEFTLLGSQPRPWRVQDSLLVGLQMYRTLATSWQRDLAKYQMLQGGDREKVEYLFPGRSGGGLIAGSNAWAIAGSRTATGRPLLANDTHLAMSIPDVWHMVHLDAPDLRVAGVALPGVPGVILGHNEHIAWGVTNLGFDVQDLFSIEFNPATGAYRWQGKPEQARLEKDFIRVKDGNPVEFNQWVTRHGPIIGQAGDRYFVLRSAVAEPDGTVFPILTLNRARNWEEFRAALAAWSEPSQNFVYADREGNIGYQAAGRLPIRKGFAGDVPVDGSSAQFVWDGYVPFEALPSHYNPASGMVVSANQDPFPANFAYPVHGRFDPGYRAETIRAELEKRSDWAPDATLSLQSDSYSPFHVALAEHLKEAAQSKGVPGPEAGVALETLQGWDGRMEPLMAAPMVLELTYQHLKTAIAERAAPGRATSYDSPHARRVVEQLLRERPQDWFEDYDALLLAALRSAVEEGTRMQGSDPRKWTWGKFHQLQVLHPIGGRLPLAHYRFNVGTVQFRGSPVSVHQINGSVTPSMRMVVDLGDWDRSLLNLRVGQSGHVLSSHYKDQWEAYFRGTSFPFRFVSPELSSTLEVTVDLRDTGVTSARR